MTLDKLVEGDILSTCNALGNEVRGVYQKGHDCINSLKDVLLYLKKDNDDHSILCFLGSIRVLQNDLLPLVKRYDKDIEIFDFTLRILIALTNPALLIYKENIPDDKLARHTYLQLISYLQSYKKAFVDIDVWKVLYEHLKDLLKVRPIERSNNENLFIERILILIRNVLHVPSDETAGKQTGDDDSTHDKIIKCLHESKINLLLLYICAHEEEHKYCLHVLEITSLMLREHTTETLSRANETRSTTEKDEDLKALLAAREREQKLKIQKIQSFSSSRFKGVYCVKNMKSLSDNDYISHKLITSPDDVKFDLQKNYRRKPKNKVRAPDVDNTRQSTLSVRLLLKKFCIEFLETYNKVMLSVKRELSRKIGEDNDDSYYLWAICYFMQFNRLYDFNSALVSETISVQSFHHIQTQITNYQEMMLTDKQKAKVWAKRVQLGVSAYKELLETLKMMEKSPDEAVRETADSLISHVFYVIEYREMLLSLLSNYDEVKFSLSYLAELIESTQIFLKMLENHSKKHSEIIVQKKKKVHKKKKKKSVVAADEIVDETENLNEKWNGIINDISEAIQQKDHVPDVTPFDASSEIPFEEQKVEAMYKIREALIAGEPLEAVGLLRAARELWPDGNSFGAVDIDPESELNILREVYYSGLQRDPSKKKEVEESDYDEENEEIETQSSVCEQKLDIDDVYKRYANHKVVYPSSLLLANYQNNKPQTNLCLIKLLHRIAWNCKMHGLFFQSTIFLTFQKIFHDPDINSNPIIKEFYRFAKFIVGKFFVAVETNKKNFVEMLFWKNHKEAHELEEGYGTSDKVSRGWTEEEEEELKYLFEENKDIYIEGQDVADIILANLNTRKRTKLQVRRALKRLGLIKNANDLKPEKRKEWLETEIVELQHLFEDNKDSGDIMTVILEKLSIKRGRKAVVEKLLELNLIADKKEIRKKSSKKHTKNSQNPGLDENEDSFQDSEDDDNDFNDNTTQNFDSSSDENESTFFKNLREERFDNDEDDPPLHSKKGVSNSVQPKKRAKSKKSEVIWDALEIAELTNLFYENSESNDIMHDILDSLSKKRSKEAVIEKLLELGLINSEKEIEKKNSSETPVIWDELEVAELTHLFHENSKSDDVIHDILNSLSKKQSKEAVVEKLLELGLIKSKNEFEKKDKDKMLNLTSNEDSESDLDTPVYKKVIGKTEKKSLKRQILSDSDEDMHNSTSKDVKGTLPGISQSKKKQSKAWNEEEIVQLNQLFYEHKEDDDILSNIVNSLIIKRTKKDVIEKMLEIGLIKNKTDLKKKKMFNKTGFSKENTNKVSKKYKSKKPSDVWEESELVELNQLYQNHKGSDDVIANILNGLTLKRNRKDIVEKMLEIGLIVDKKEIRKRRISKKAKDTQNLHKKAELDDDEPYQNLNDNNISSKVISSDSSDNEDVPLIFVPNTSSKKNTPSNSQLHSEIHTMEEVSEMTANYDQISKLDSDSPQISSTESSHARKLSGHNKRKRLVIDSDSDDEDNNKISSDLSDNEDAPLNFVSNASLKNNAASNSQLHSEMQVMKEVSEMPGKISENYDQISKLKSNSHQISSTESTCANELSGHNKRKRLVIDSDSDDDDNKLVVKDLNNGDSLYGSISVPDPTENLQEKSLFKKQKKKIRVLDESDESS